MLMPSIFMYSQRSNSGLTVKITTFAMVTIIKGLEFVEPIRHPVNITTFAIFRSLLISFSGLEGSHTLSGALCVVWFGFPGRGPVSSSFWGSGSGFTGQETLV